MTSRILQYMLTKMQLLNIEFINPIKNKISIWATVLHMFTLVFIWDGSQDNQKNWVPSMVPHNLWLIWMGMKQKEKCQQKIENWWIQKNEISDF